LRRRPRLGHRRRGPRRRAGARQRARRPNRGVAAGRRALPRPVRLVPGPQRPALRRPDGRGDRGLPGVTLAVRADREVRTWHLAAGGGLLVVVALGSLFIGVSDITPMDLLRADEARV